MSDYTPTPDEAFDATLYTWLDWKGTFKNEDDARAAWDRMIAEVERAAAAKALTEAVSDWESGTVEHDEIKYSSDAPLGWCDESVVDAVMASGPTMDWLRTRAEAYRQERGEQ